MEKRIITVPNLLSFLRILLIIPLSYALNSGKSSTAFAVFLLSGITDIADGFIARHFNMVSNLGKILDPIADKLTQGVLLLCLAVRYRGLIKLLVLLIVKETILAVLGLIAVGTTGAVKSSATHGKLAAALLYITLGSHMLLPAMGDTASSVLIFSTGCAMLVSLVLYVRRDFAQIRSGRANPPVDTRT